MLWLIVLLLSMVVVTGTVIILFRPEVFGMGLTGDLTSTSRVYENTAAALQSTVDANATAAFNVNSTSAAVVAVAFDLNSTQAALENRANVLRQAETQSALDALSTETSQALENARQATQNAVDFRATQSAFDRIATQVELDYQGTQAALNRDATAAVLGFMTNRPPAPDVLTQTPPPTITEIPLIQDGFSSGVGASLWQMGNPADWALKGDANLSAQRSGSWLMTQVTNLSSYALQITLTPLTSSSDYYILLNAQDDPLEDGLTLRLSWDGSRLTAAGLFTFNRAQLTDEFGLLDADLSAVHAVQVNMPAAATLGVYVEVRGEHIVVVANNTLIVDTTLDSALLPGAVGLQVPQGTAVQDVTLFP